MAMKIIKPGSFAWPDKYARMRRLAKVVRAIDEMRFAQKVKISEACIHYGIVPAHLSRLRKRLEEFTQSYPDWPLDEDQFGVRPSSNSANTPETHSTTNVTETTELQVNCTQGDSDNHHGQ